MKNNIIIFKEVWTLTFWPFNFIWPLTRYRNSQSSFMTVLLRSKRDILCADFRTSLAPKFPQLYEEQYHNFQGSLDTDILAIQFYLAPHTLQKFAKLIYDSTSSVKTRHIVRGFSHFSRAKISSAI